MKAERLLKIIYTCLQRERVTVAELAQKLEVSRRTIFRDLQALDAAGVPVVTYPGSGGGIGILEDFKLDKSLLTDDDFSRLATALNSIHSIDGNKETELLMDKLIPPDKRGAGGSDIIIDLSSWFENEGVDDTFAGLRKAIAQRRYVRLAYSARGMPTERLVEPYKLVFKYHDWYLYAYCLMREDYRMFKLARISGYSVLPEGFAARQLGDLLFQLPALENREAQADAAAPVEVVLEYHARDREYLMDRLGAHNFDDDDETGLVQFHTDNLRWTTDLVMSLQDKVRVLQPPQLRAEVLRRIDAMRAVYSEE